MTTPTSTASADPSAVSPTEDAWDAHWAEPAFADRTLGQILDTRAAEHPHDTFLITEEGTLTYRELADRVARVSGGLAALGVGQGDAVLVMLPSGADFVVTWFAAARIGAVQVPVNTAYRGMLLEHVVATSGAAVAIVAAEHRGLFDLSRAPYDGLRHVVVQPGDRTEDGPAPDIQLADLERHGTAPVPDIHPTDPAAILFSSGTTGPSKGILLSHHYFWFHADRSARRGQVRPDERFYTCLPLFHANAQVLSVTAALVTGTAVVLDRRFSASGFWDRLRATGATRFNYIGGMIPILMKQPPTERDHEHRVRYGIGAAAPADQLEAFEDRFGLTLVENYGQTENCVALANALDDRRVGSVGKAICGFEVAVVDDDDHPVGPDVVGELVFRPQSPHIMMSGYHDMPDAMVAATRNLWFHTGDYVRRDADGFHYFVDRKKDAIRRRGENISAYEVELVVDSHPDVLESAAIAVPSDVGEDEVMVVVVPRTGSGLDPLDLVRHCEDRMPYFAVPRYVDVRDELPKTPTHRVEKYRLREDGVTPTTWDRETSGHVVRR